MSKPSTFSRPSRDTCVLLVPVPFIFTRNIILFRKLALSKWMYATIGRTVLLRSLLVFNFFREDEFSGKCVCALWSGFLYRQLQNFKVHNHQLRIRHQDWKMAEPQDQFTNQYDYNSIVANNPRERVLYAWDNRRLVTYPIMLRNTRLTTWSAARC